MLRVILLVAGVAALVWLVRRAFDPAASESRPERAARDGAKAGVDELVRCAHCGVHVPRVEAQALDGRHFCSSEHARLGARGDKT